MPCLVSAYRLGGLPGRVLHQRLLRRAPPLLASAVTTASSVPSPPSAMGRRDDFGSGQHPFEAGLQCVADALSAESEPLNESGAERFSCARIVATVAVGSAVAGYRSSGDEPCVARRSRSFTASHSGVSGGVSTISVP